jgi:hypothetical protein
MAGAIALAVLIGAWEFPRAEEPGRAERDGIVLQLDGARLDGAGDWSVDLDAASVDYVPGGVRLHARSARTTYELVSRDLAVFPHTCYAVRVEGRQLAPGTAVRVTRGDLGDALTPDAPFADATDASGLVLSSAGERRITFALVGKSPATVVVRRVRLVRLPDTATC